MTARYSAADYAAAARALLPRGLVWPTEPDTVQARFFGALGREFEASDGDAVALIIDAFPASTANLLPEWEESLGLPDPCLGPNPTIQQRQDQVLARFIGSGGQSAQFYTSYAALLGFIIKVDVFSTFRTGHSRCGTALAGEGWAHTWRVRILSGDAGDHAAFRTGISRCSEPLGSVSSGVATLECELRSLAPAHTNLIFAS